MNNLRPVIISEGTELEKTAKFHQFAQGIAANNVGVSHSVPVALIEYENGRVGEVSATLIRFIDVVLPFKERPYLSIPARALKKGDWIKSAGIEWEIIGTRQLELAATDEPTDRKIEFRLSDGVAPSTITFNNLDSVQAKCKGPS